MFGSVRGRKKLYGLRLSQYVLGIHVNVKLVFFFSGYIYIYIYVLGIYLGFIHKTVCFRPECKSIRIRKPTFEQKYMKVFQALKTFHV